VRSRKGKRQVIVLEQARIRECRDVAEQPAVERQYLDAERSIPSTRLIPVIVREGRVRIGTDCHQARPAGRITGKNSFLTPSLDNAIRCC
jgi:hypothetical protein